MKSIANFKLLAVIAVVLVSILGILAMNRADTKAQEADQQAFRKFLFEPRNNQESGKATDAAGK